MKLNLLLGVLPIVTATPFHQFKRNIINDANQVNIVNQLLDQTYDYIIAGAGIGGLITANRLTEDENTRVLVIEAGGNGDDVRERIDIPAQAYLDGLPVDGSPYDWAIYTEAQSNLNGRNLHWPRGKIVGGSTAVNALYMTRSTKDQHDAWSELIDDDGWNWDNLLPYFRRFETFTTPKKSLEKNLSIEIEHSAHGYDGGIQISFPQYNYPQNGLWQPTFENLGIDSDKDPFSGQNIGGYITPNSIDPDTQLRSYAASAYLYPIETSRSNLVVLTDALVTRVNFDTSSARPKANGVSFRANGNNDEFQAHATNEVVIAGGTLGSPQILLQSGIGPRENLESQNVNVLVDLPGVGAHLQDHISATVEFSTTAPVGGSLSDSELDEQLEIFREGHFARSLYSTPNGAIAYIPLEDIMGDETSTFLDQLEANMTDATSSGDDPDEVKAGYRATYESDLENVYKAGNAVVEILMNNLGSNLGFQLALQHPFSRGKIYLGSSDTSENAKVDPLYLSHPADIQLIRNGLKYIRRLAATEPISTMIRDEVSPGLGTSSDDDLDDYIRNSAVSQYHPASSCAMLPEENGGVVDSQMRVYNVDNLRVIDSSTIPLPVAAHHMQVTYAICEKGADLIRGYQKASDSPSATDSESGASLSKHFNGQLLITMMIIASIVNGL
ncbi:alcohol oxidase [Wallemia mellicola]|nr:alcohol oxidase [Wallemia mellicola]